MTALQMIRTYAFAAITTVLLLASTRIANAAPTSKGYVKTEGLDVYYEIHGTLAPQKTPLLLVHGAFCTIEVCFGNVIPELAKTRPVIAIELQGHGRTRDAKRPFTLTQMTKDTLAVLAKLGVTKADIWGYSMGAGVALELAITKPAVVNRLVLMSISYAKDGVHAGVLEGMEHITPEMFYETPWYKGYKAVAPVDTFSSLVEKIKKIDDTKTWPDKTIRALPMPVQIIIGDGDIVKPDHAVKFFQLLGGGVAADMVGPAKSQLAIIAGATHVTVAQKTTQLIATVVPFLDEKPAVAKK
jgi:pimeloyl-ACP methyl ester carboxylesterase